MFAKLKKRIAAETDAGVQGPGLEATGGPGLPGHVIRKKPNNTNSDDISESGSTVGDDSMSVSSTDNTPGEGSKDDLLRLLLRREKQVKRLQLKISENERDLNEKDKLKQQLEGALEQQQDASLKRLQELSDNFQTSRNKMLADEQNIIHELRERVAKLEKENEQLSGEGAGFRREYVNKVEETEELQEKQIQETAKIKHLLLNTQEELSELKQKLKQKTSSLVELERQHYGVVERFEVLVRSADTTQQHVEQLTLQLSAVESEKNTIIRQLTDNQQIIQTQLDTTRKQLNERCLNAMSGEREHTEIVDKLEQLTHQHDTYKQKAETQLQERAALIEHLEEKVRNLDKRQNTASMSDNEQVAALLAERRSLEQRVEESRQQLSDIKTIWSDRITQLEQQITHLNSKIVEDASEISSQTEFINHLNNEHSRQVYDLNQKIAEANRGEEESTEQARHSQTALTKQCEQHRAELQRIEEKQQQTCLQLHTQIDEAEERAASSEAAREFHRTAADLRIQHLEGTMTEVVTRNLDSDIVVSQLKNELTSSLRDSQVLSNRLEDSQLQVEQLQTKLMLMHQSLSDNNRLISDSEIEYKKLTEQLQAAVQDNEVLVRENSELRSIVETSSSAHSGLGDTISDNNKQIEQLQYSLSERDEHIKTLLNQISEVELRENMTRISATVDDEAELSQLRIQNMDYEAQLAERNKTIKMLQQRLTDMKKLLHKELKVQPPSNNHLAPSNNNDMHNSKSSSGRLTPNYYPPFRSHSNSPSNLSTMKSYSMENVMLGPDNVNFKYLKHVIFKFMLCTEHEAYQLIRAVSALLKFSAEEEDLIKQTLEWKSSWFRQRPTYSPSNPNHT